MEALKKKIKSSRGSSLLIAMLFMLACMTIGASIFMVADANASKAASNRDIQQKYLAVSSAVRMIVDELESVQFYGVYTYTKTGLDESGAPPADPSDPVHHYGHAYSLVEDSAYFPNSAVRMERRDDGNAPLTGFNAPLMTDFLPLVQNMEGILRRAFKVNVMANMEENIDSNPYDVSVPGDLTTLSEGPAIRDKCRLYVDVDDVDTIGTVIVDVELYETRIKLSGHLENDDYLVKAELVNENLPSARFGFTFDDTTAGTGEIKSEPFRWNLNYFTSAANAA